MRSCTANLILLLLVSTLVALWVWSYPVDPIRSVRPRDTRPRTTTHSSPGHRYDDVKDDMGFVPWPTSSTFCAVAPEGENTFVPDEEGNRRHLHLPNSVLGEGVDIDVESAFPVGVHTLSPFRNVMDMGAIAAMLFDHEDGGVDVEAHALHDRMGLIFAHQRVQGGSADLDDDEFADMPGLLIDIEDDYDDEDGARGRQNVHDHSVASITRENLRRMRETQSHVRDLPGVRERVLDFCLSSDDHSDEVKQDAVDVIDTLTAANNASAGDSQLGALVTVWTAISNLADSDTRHNVRNTLVDQLAEAKERGNVVCSTGVISRIASVLDGVADTTLADRQTPMPMWVLRQEIAALAAKIRASTENDDSKPARACARREFEHRARSEYIDRLGLSETVMVPIISEFAEHL